MSARPNLVVIGGGTGSYELLDGLRDEPVELTAVVNMCDDGGSTGELRRDYGVLPPGDLRQCLVALAREHDLARVLSHRFSGGVLGGHPAGNILLAAAQSQLGSVDAVNLVSKILDCAGAVMPATTTQHQLMLRDGGEIVRGQESVRLHTISHPEDVRLALAPNPELYAGARDAILGADLVVIAPGGLYWTLLPVMAIPGVSESLQQTDAKIVCVSNLMNRPEQHRGWHVADYVQEMEKYVGVGVIDVVLYNNYPIPSSLREQYAFEGELPVGTDVERFSELSVAHIGADLLATQPATQDVADVSVRRTLIRHDSGKTATAILALLEEGRVYMDAETRGRPRAN